MKIAVINEISSCDRNGDIISALNGIGHEIINIGMTKKEDKPELSYIHTGLLAAILLNLRKVDFVIGGCGTGQGFLNSVMQYPGIFCGHILTPLDAWLFAKINSGNCISLALNQGYGWAGELNLKFIFDKLFKTKFGEGYPMSRSKFQAKSRALLAEISKNTHYLLYDIINRINGVIINPVLRFPGVLELINVENIEDEKLKQAFLKRLDKL